VGFGGLDAPAFMTLLKVPGSGLSKVAQIKAAFELGKRGGPREAHKPRHRVLKGCAQSFRPLSPAKRREIVIAVFLNGQNQRLGEKDITRDADPGTVYVRRVLEEALHESAAAVVLVHNHPRHPEPSAVMTRRPATSCAPVNWWVWSCLTTLIVGDRPLQLRRLGSA